ncbi:MAG TPA: DNA-primase RepB domain-containing protein [Solirubrobacteraceae bacterium]|jgi:hypothetical protein|nr:DNA-primase RepB domain-containing protein [Solirubrobacteraceae bacterium]
MRSAPDTRRLELERFLRALCCDAPPGRFLDVRWRRPGSPMKRRFVPASGSARARSLIAGLAPKSDVYVGVALRDGDQQGGRGAITSCRFVWLESDHALTAERLRAFARQPSILIASGTPGHIQAYWKLDRAHPAHAVEAINRRLAYALAGDSGCADIARILRPPGTLNHKHDAPRPVTLLALREDWTTSLQELGSLLPRDPDPPAFRARSKARRRAGTGALDQALLAVPAAEYVRVLAELEPNREGKVSCPFHEDSNPSLQLYPDGGFYCFGSDCRRGGTIYDFAGHLWGINPRGEGFLELRERLASHFALPVRTSR